MPRDWARCPATTDRLGRYTGPEPGFHTSAPRGHGFDPERGTESAAAVSSAHGVVDQPPRGGTDVGRAHPQRVLRARAGDDQFGERNRTGSGVEPPSSERSSSSRNSSEHVLYSNHHVNQLHFTSGLIVRYCSPCQQPSKGLVLSSPCAEPCTAVRVHCCGASWLEQDGLH